MYYLKHLKSFLLLNHNKKEYSLGKKIFQKTPTQTNLSLPSDPGHTESDPKQEPALGAAKPKGKLDSCSQVPSKKPSRVAYLGDELIGRCTRRPHHCSLQKKKNWLVKKGIKILAFTPIKKVFLSIPTIFNHVVQFSYAHREENKLFLHIIINFFPNPFHIFFCFELAVLVISVVLFLSGSYLATEVLKEQPDTSCRLTVRKSPWILF